MLNYSLGNIIIDYPQFKVIQNVFNLNASRRILFKD